MQGSGAGRNGGTTAGRMANQERLTFRTRGFDLFCTPREESRLPFGKQGQARPMERSRVGQKTSWGGV
jgi:hypothetical protein